MQDRYDNYGDAMQPVEYVKFLYDRMAEAVVQAWDQRAAGAVAWGLGHAVVGNNRRAVFSDGSAVMYGDTNKPTFRQIEGYEDHAVDLLFFYNSQKQLRAAAITVACPSQSVTGSSLSADFWHDVRELVHQRHGAGVCVLGFCARRGTRPPTCCFARRAKNG